MIGSVRFRNPGPIEPALRRVWRKTRCIWTRATSKSTQSLPDTFRGIEGTLKGQPKIRDAFLDACMADDQFQSPKVAEKLAKDRALRWATGPLVDVHEGLIKPPVQGRIVDACGFTDTFGLRKPFVIITSFWFDALEFGFDLDPNRAGNRLMRTLLHELVHWVRDQAKASDEILVGGYKGHYKEAGHVFEENAYGTANICTENEIWDAILSRRD